MRAVNPLMGADLIIIVFAVVVIGGLGLDLRLGRRRLRHRPRAGLGRGLRSRCPLVSQTLVFVLMAGVLLCARPGLFGREEARMTSTVDTPTDAPLGATVRADRRGPGPRLGPVRAARRRPGRRGVAAHGLYPPVAMDILCWALFAVAVDLLLGFTGLLSFGHAAFWGTSAYVTGLVAIHAALPFPVAVLGGALAAACSRCRSATWRCERTGIYFAMVTLAFAQMVYFVANQWRS